MLANYGPALLVPGVGHNVEVGGPHLKLPLPVYDGGEWGTHQKWALGVTLGFLGGGGDQCITDRPDS